MASYDEVSMSLGLGLGLNLVRPQNFLVKQFSFENDTTLPSDLTLTRTGGGWFGDADGYIQYESNTNAARFGKSWDSATGLLVEVAVTAINLYSRPSTGTVGDHLSAGSSIASIVTDADNPCKDLTSGTNVWLLDNTGGGAPVDVDFAGAITGGSSAAAYIETVTGDDASLSIGGTGSEVISPYKVAGYSLHYVVGVTGSSSPLRITVPAGSSVRVACVNLQQNLGLTSFIDTAGSTVTRNKDTLSGDPSFWNNTATGTFVLDWTTNGRASLTGGIFQVNDTGNANNFYFFQTGGTAYVQTRSSSVVTNRAVDDIIYGQRTRRAISYENQNILGSQNGAELFTDTTANAPIVSGFNAFSFGANVGGVVHSFKLFSKTTNMNDLNSLTNPNLSQEVYTLLIGDSNFERWEGSFGGRPNQLMIDTLNSGVPPKVSVYTNEGKSGSCANYAAAIALVADRWSNNGDTAGGNAFTESLARNETLTINQVKKFDYIGFNLGINDVKEIKTGTITAAQLETSILNVMDLCVETYGADVKFILQNVGTLNSTDHDDEDVQALRDIHSTIYSIYNFIGEYDTYDVTLVDAVHPDEDGYNKFVDRMSNIILADLGVEPLEVQPQIIGGRWGQDKVYLVCDSDNMTGTDTAIFTILDDGVPVTISSSSIIGKQIELTLSSPIANGSTVTYYVGYGKIAGIVEANVFKDSVTGLPLKTLGLTSNLTFDDTI